MKVNDVATEAPAVSVNVLTSAMRKTDGRYKLSLAIVAVLNALFLAVIAYQTKEGHIVQGLGNEGAYWGLLVANIVNLIGISHVGIAISAFVRVMDLKRYRQLARLAEFLTLASLTAAVLNIGLDVGRIDRFVEYTFWFGNWSSPFVWSLTVISTYLLATCAYLYLAMRRDIALSAHLVPSRKWFYGPLSLGYADTEPERRVNAKTVWWLAVLIVPVMVSVHSVYGLVFGLHAGRPGWFTSFMAPYFVLGAVVSGFSMMILVLAMVRKLFRWESVFDAKVFRGLGTFLGFMSLLYIYFLLAELITGRYAPPKGELGVYNDLVHGRFAVFFWLTFVGGFILPFLLLFTQWARRKANIALTVTCALLLNVGMWTIRSLIVVPTFYHPLLPYHVGRYSPTWVEWALIAGTYVFAALLYLILVKLFPPLELPHDMKLEGAPADVPRLSPARRALAGITAVLGLGLVTLGFSLAHRADTPASAIWVAGIFLIVTVPVQISVWHPFRKA